TVSASIRRRWTRVRKRPTRSGASQKALRRRPRSRAAPLRTADSPCAAAVLGRGDTERPQPAQVQGGAGEVPLVAHLRHAAEDEAPIACWISACRRKTCRTRAGRIAQRGGGGAVAAPMR